MVSAQEIILQYVCPAFGTIAANFMFAGEFLSSHTVPLYLLDGVDISCSSANKHRFSSTIQRCAQRSKTWYVGPFESNSVGSHDGQLLWLGNIFVFDSGALRIYAFANYYLHSQHISSYLSSSLDVIELVCILGKCSRFCAFHMVKYGSNKTSIL